MKSKENSVSESKSERKRVAATMEVVQPRPNASTAQTAAGAIAEPIASRAQGGSQRDKITKGS